jgi:hypothetical protein
VPKLLIDERWNVSRRDVSFRTAGVVFIQLVRGTTFPGASFPGTMISRVRRAPRLPRLAPRPSRAGSASAPSRPPGGAPRAPPPPPPRNGREDAEILKLFEATKNASGINFDKYDDIPVEVTPNHSELGTKPLETYADDLSMHPAVMDNIKLAGYTKPTPVQVATHY